MPGLRDIPGVIGLAEVARKLADLPPRVERRVTKNAMYRGATFIRDEARRSAPVDSGALKSKIIAKAKPLGPGVFYASAGVASGIYVRGKREGKRPRRYAHLVEFGTVHSSASPFVRPIIDRGNEIFNKVFEEARKSFDEQFAKLGTGGS